MITLKIYQESFTELIRILYDYRRVNFNYDRGNKQKMSTAKDPHSQALITLLRCRVSAPLLSVVECTGMSVAGARVVKGAGLNLQS